METAKKTNHEDINYKNSKIKNSVFKGRSLSHQINQVKR